MAYKAISMPSASAPSLSQVNVTNFLGVDLTNQPSNVDKSRSPEAPNMIRDVPGKVRKRMGWHTLLTMDEQINGYHPLANHDPLLHVGTSLYKLPGGMTGLAAYGAALENGEAS